MSSVENVSKLQKAAKTVAFIFIVDRAHHKVLLPPPPPPPHTFPKHQHR